MKKFLSDLAILMFQLRDRIYRKPSKLAPMANWERFYGGGRSLFEIAREHSYNRLRFPVVINWIEGLKHTVAPRNDMGRVLYISGTYEPNSLFVMKKILKKGSIFFDIGANAGPFTGPASRWVGESGRVYAFEPSTREMELLKETLALNKLSNVSIEKLAITDRKGFSEIHLAKKEHNGQNTLCAEFAYENVDSGKIERVQTHTIDDYVAENQISRIDLIKLDVEGGEFAALKGASKTLETLKPSLIIEIVRSALSKNNIDIQEVENFLIQKGYQTYRIVGVLHNPVEEAA